MSRAVEAGPRPTRIGGKFVKAGPQLDYLSILFKEGDKALEPEGSVEVVGRIHKEDWSKYDQGNDYSFSDSAAEQEWKRITAYVGNALTWGIEPGLK